MPSEKQMPLKQMSLKQIFKRQLAELEATCAELFDDGWQTIFVKIKNKGSELETTVEISKQQDFLDGDEDYD